MMNKEQKKNYITEITAQFENSKAVMVTHYQGLTMPQLDELRSKIPSSATGGSRGSPPAGPCV